jgi:hypothetical protein
MAVAVAVADQPVGLEEGRDDEFIYDIEPEEPASLLQTLYNTMATPEEEEELVDEEEPVEEEELVEEVKGEPRDNAEVDDEVDENIDVVKLMRQLQHDLEQVRQTCDKIEERLASIELTGKKVESQWNIKHLHSDDGDGDGGGDGGAAAESQPDDDDQPSDPVVTFVVAPLVADAKKRDYSQFM